MTKEEIQDFTVRVTSANKTEMIVILYDIALTYIKDAVSCLDRENKPQFRIEIGRVRNAIKELMDSVDTSLDLGMRLLQLYIFCSGELTKGYIDYDKDPLYHVMSILKKLRDAYNEKTKLDTSGPVMKNVETVYEGFTYNKSSRMQSVTVADANRGILA